MNINVARRPHSIFTESFIPVLLVLSLIYLGVLFVQFRSTTDVVDHIVIEIPGNVDQSSMEEMEDQVLAPLPSVDTASAAVTPEHEQARKLMAEGAYRAAEALLSPMVNDHTDPHVLSDYASVLYNLEKRDEALKYVQKALSLNPQDQNTLFLRATIRLDRNELKTSLADFIAVQKINPFHFEATYNAGFVSVRMKQYQQANQYYEKAIALAGGERKARALFALGRNTLSLKPSDEVAAEKSFRAALRIRPDYIAPRFALARLYSKTPERFDDAIEEYSKITELKPSYAPAWFNLAKLASSLNNTHQAKDYYATAIRYAPNYYKARHNLGLILLAEEEWEQALAQFSYNDTHTSPDASSRFLLGRAYYGLKNHDAAVAAYQSALAAGGDLEPEILLNLGLVWTAKGDEKKAISAYRKAISARPGYAEAWYNLGVLHLRKKRYDQAKAAFKESIKQDERPYKSWFNIARIYTEQDKNKDAIAAYEKALEIKPDYQSAKLNLAVRYSRIGRDDKAIALYRGVLAQDSSYATAWLNLGIAQLRMKAYTDAEESLRQALSQMQEDVKVRRLLAQALYEQRRYDESESLLREAIDMESGNVLLRRDLVTTLVGAGKRQQAKAQLDKVKRLTTDRSVIAELEQLINGR